MDGFLIIHYNISKVSYGVYAFNQISNSNKSNVSLRFDLNLKTKTMTIHIFSKYSKYLHLMETFINKGGLKQMISHFTTLDGKRINLDDINYGLNTIRLH
jgi:hypothetical protein